MANRDEVHAWEKWTYEPKFEQFALKSHHGFYLSATPSGKVHNLTDDLAGPPVSSVCTYIYNAAVMMSADCRR